MEISRDKIAILPSCDAAFTVDADTARVTNHFAYHVLGCVILEAESLRQLIILATDGPFGDVIWPFMWRNRRWSVTVLRIEATHATGNATTWAGIARRPLFPCGNRFLK